MLFYMSLKHIANVYISNIIIKLPNLPIYCVEAGRANKLRIMYIPPCVTPPTYRAFILMLRIVA